jgi:hypothetical protein
MLMQISQTAQPPWWSRMPLPQGEAFCMLAVLIAIAVFAFIALGRRSPKRK